MVTGGVPVEKFLVRNFYVVWKRIELLG